MAQAPPAKPGAHLRDRPGRRPARVRLLLPPQQADRPHRRGRRGSQRGAIRAGPPPTGDARENGPTFMQVRPAALDAAGCPPAGHHRGAPRPPGRRHAVLLRGGCAGDRGGVLASRSSGFSASSTRCRWPPPRSARFIAPSSRTDARSPSRCSGQVRRARSRRTSTSCTRPPASRRSASVRSTSSTRRGSSTSSPARFDRSSTTASRRATRRPSARTSRATRT